MRNKQRKTLLSVCSALAAITMVGGAGMMLQTAEAATPMFEMIYGAGIRASDPTGIRFKAKLGAEYYEQLQNGTDNAQLHFVLLPYAMYEAYQADSAKGTTALYPWLISKYTASGIVDVAVGADKLYTVEEDGETYYCANGVLANVYFNNYHLNFVGAAYIQRGTEGNYTYEDVKGINAFDNARSVFEVACKASQNEVDYGKYKDFLDETVEKGLYRAYGVACQESVDGEGNKTTESYTYGGTTYYSYEELKSGLGISIEDSVVTISEETVTLPGGIQQQLSATFTYSDGTAYEKEAYYTWSSSDSSIVSVDENGMMTAKGLGEATITVTAIGGRFSDTCEVSVTKGGTVNLDYQFYAEGDAGLRVENTGNATVDLSEIGIVGTTVEKVLCGGEEIAIAGKTETTVTLVDAPAGNQEYTFQTTVADYVFDGFVYGFGISTKQDFLDWQTAAAAGTTKCYTVLLNDIDLEGVTLAEPTTYFYGNFDGLRHTVSNFTITKGMVWLMYPSVVENAQFMNVVQDCTFSGTSVVTYGFFGSVVRGTIQNVKVSMSTINVGNVHRGLIAFAFNNGNTAGAPAVIQNVIMEAAPQTDYKHYAYQAQATTAGLSSIDSVYMYFTNGAAGGFDIWNDGVYTNSGFYASKSAMVSAVDFSTWGEPWQIGADGVPYLGEKIIREEIVIAGQFLGKGDASINDTSANTGNVTIDLSSTRYDFSATTQVLCNGENIAITGKTATTVTVSNAPQGNGEYTIITPTTVYTVNVCVYMNGISTAEEFLAWQTAAAAGTANKAYTVLLNDINLGGATLATPTEYYREGTFDGLSHTVSNFTYTKGVIWMYANSVVKNVQFTNAVQDCSFAGTGVVLYGFFGNNLRGRVENIKISVSTTNVSAIHRGVIVCVLNNANTAGVAGILQNVIAEVTPQTDFEHYAYQAQATVEGLSSIDSVYMYFTNGAAGGFDIWGGGGAYTNSGFFASKSAMVSAVDFSTWGEPWKIGDDGVPYMGKPKELVTVSIDGVTNVGATGEANSDKTGRAAVDFAKLGYTLGEVFSVKCGTMDVSFSAAGDVLTLINAPAGEKVYTVTTGDVKYIVTLNVYIIVKEQVEISGTFYGTDNDVSTLAIESAAVDFSGSEMDLSSIMSVTYGDGTALGYTAVGNVVTFADAPAGTQTYTITTETHIYTVNICFYGLCISTKAEFLSWQTAAAAGTGKGYVVILNDIDLEGATLATPSTYYYGSLDGLSHTVSNFTYTKGVIWMYSSTFKNVQFTDAVQDCSFAGTEVVLYGFFGNNLRGRVENVKISVSTINVGNIHRSIIVCGLNQYNTAGVAGVLQNVIVEVMPQTDFAHYAYQAQATTAGLASIDSVYMYFTNGATGGFDIWNAGGPYTNSGWFASKEAMVSSVSFASWGKPWNIGTDGVPYLGEAIVRETITLTEEFFAKGDASISEQNANTGNATVDFTDAEVSLGNVLSVTYGADNTVATYTANGDALTLVNAPAGTQTYTIVTNVNTYIVDICVYNFGISNKTEFYSWRDTRMWKYAVLLNDIDLEGDVLAAAGAAAVNGTLDGRGHKISNFTVSTGLVKTVQASGTIKNISFVNAMQDCTGIETAAVKAVRYGFITQTLAGTIENVSIQGRVYNVAAGIAHWGMLVYNSQATAVVKNVVMDVTSDCVEANMVINTTTFQEIDNVHLYFKSTDASYNGKVVIMDSGATNSAVYRTYGEILTADFSRFTGIWKVESGKLPYMGDSYADENFVHGGYEGTTSYNLIENGASEYKVLMNGVTYEETWTTYIEFRTYLAEATGVTLAWSNDQYASNYNESAKFISLGKTAALEKSGIEVDYDLIGEQGYQIITLGDDIYVCGENEGLSYAIYDLLYRLVGLEVYTTSRYVIDTVTDVALPDLYITEVPDIEYRIPVSGEMSQYTSEGNATRRALHLNQLDSAIVTGGTSHNVTMTVVPYETNSSQTKWFYNNGEQLCYTARGDAAAYEAMVAEAVKNIKALLLADTDSNLFSITQMDSKSWCNCTACSALKTKYGTDAVSQIYFVNDVTSILAEWLETEQGGREVQFAIFAYYTTKTAPATQNVDGSWTAIDESVILNDNVSVWIAPIEDDFRININETNTTNNMRTMIESWSACASSYFIWAYDAYFNNYMIPYDTYDAIQDMIRFCAEYNTKMFFVNGAWDLSQNTAFGDLKDYLYAKLMWNCNLDVNTLIENFFADVYKEAGDTMKQVFEAWRAKSATFGGNIYSSSDSWYEIYKTFDNTWLNSQLGLLETAISQISAYKTSNETLYNAIYDSIVAESISLRYLYKQRNSREYSSSAWGTLASDAARLGVNKVSEHTDF